MYIISNVSHLNIEKSVALTFQTQDMASSFLLGMLGTRTGLSDPVGLRVLFGYQVFK